MYSIKEWNTLLTDLADETLQKEIEYEKRNVNTLFFPFYTITLFMQIVK
mgnify:FL=1